MDALLCKHPRWEELKIKLDQGSTFPLQELPEESRVIVFIRGNHKSAQTHETFLANAIEKETKKGWLIILPEEKFDKIPNLVLSPMGIAESMGITASGNFEEKLRVTHNLPFTGAFSGESRVTKEQLEPCMFGHALLRIILHSSYKIWIRTEDMKSA